MTKEVVETKPNELANPNDFGGWGDSNVLETSDIIIPKILLMQSDSKLVEEEKAKNKDFVNSSTKDVMGTEISFTPFDMKKVFKISKKVGNSTEFVREEDWNANNDDRDKEWDEGGESYIAQKIWRFYVIVADEPIPFVLDLRGMSFATGKRLANQMFIANKVKFKGDMPAGYKIELYNEKQEYDGATKNVFNYKLGKVTSNEERKEAYVWFQTLKTKDAILDTSEDSVERAEYKDVDQVYEAPKEEKPAPKKKAAPKAASADDLPY